LTFGDGKINQQKKQPSKNYILKNAGVGNIGACQHTQIPIN